MRLLLTLALSLCIGTAVAADPVVPPAAAAFDAALAQRTGADERGMRRYVLVILKTGPMRVPDGEARDTMFAGHMANIGRLAKAGKLALAGPFMQDPAGWRGLYVFAVPEHAMERIRDELDKLAILETGSPEYGVTRNYLDWATSVPWGVHSEDKLDLAHARGVLESEHDGLEDVKERILEIALTHRCGPPFPARTTSGNCGTGRGH